MGVMKRQRIQTYSHAGHDYIVVHDFMDDILGVLASERVLIGIYIPLIQIHITFNYFTGIAMTIAHAITPG